MLVLTENFHWARNDIGQATKCTEALVLLYLHELKLISGFVQSSFGLYNGKIWNESDEY